MLKPLQNFVSQRSNILCNYFISRNILKGQNFSKMSTGGTGFSFKDIEGDLFSAPKDVSLAHCVAADLKMGAGIAVKFKQVYGRVDELKSQNVRSPGVAVLKDKDRFIYYLVTKNETYSKPTYLSLAESLEAMRSHMRENNVSKLAMPRIGCGIDGLEWEQVSKIINDTFKEENVDVTIYTFVPK